MLLWRLLPVPLLWQRSRASADNAKLVVDPLHSSPPAPCCGPAASLPLGREELVAFPRVPISRETNHIKIQFKPNKIRML